MCGRFTFTEIQKIVGRFGIVLQDGSRIVPRFNIAPSDDIPVIVEGENGRELRFMQWGFRPDWVTPQPGRPPPINARAETLLERPMFRDAAFAQRCIIPADGFFEWKAVPGARQKQPMYVRLKGGELFGFAGLYAERPAPDGSGRIASCAIVTTGPNELMAPIHTRMPAILAAGDEACWLDCRQRDPATILACLRPYPAEEMEAFAVSRLVSYVENDEPALIQPLPL
jgi:putative SOS response-associated peptidase YedK